VLAVSAREDLIEAEVALQGGAGGYVCRSAALEEIVKAIHLVADGNNYLDPALAQRIALQKLMGKSSSLRGLSPREYEVFCMLAADLPLKEIARLLNLNYKTVANYGGTIKAKLKLSTREDLRTLARRTGVIPG
jgi:DNA-binding NarL/FixJ family response regulator